MHVKSSSALQIEFNFFLASSAFGATFSAIRLIYIVLLTRESVGEYHLSMCNKSLFK